MDSDEERYGNDEDDTKARERLANGRVRQGSEGYEIQSVDRETIFRDYIQSQGDHARQYNIYEPEVHSSSSEEGGEEEEEDPEDYEPLSRQAEGVIVPAPDLLH